MDIWNKVVFIDVGKGSIYNAVVMSPNGSLQGLIETITVLVELLLFK